MWTGVYGVVDLPGRHYSAVTCPVAFTRRYACTFSSLDPLRSLEPATYSGHSAYSNGKE